MAMDSSGRFAPVTPPHDEHPRYPIDLTVHKDELWVIDRYKKLYRYDQRDFVAIAPSQLSLPENSSIFKMHSAPDSSLYFATQHGLYRFRDNHYSKVPVPGLSQDQSILSVLVLENGNLMLATNDQLIELNPVRNTASVWLDNENLAREISLFQDSEKNIWVSTMDGKLFLCYGDSPVKKHIVKVFEGTVVNHVFQDRENNIWLSTYGEGAWCVRSIHIRNYPVKSSIVSDMVLEPETHDIIITTTNAGLKFFRQDESAHIAPVENKRIGGTFSGRKLLIAGLSLPDGTMMFSSDNKLLAYRDGKTDSLLVSTPISTLYFQAGKNRLWIGNRFGLTYTDPLLDGHTEVPGFEQSIIRSVTENNKGLILLGTDTGIYLEQDSGFHLLPSVPEKRSYYVNALFREKRTGKVWAGTNEGLATIEDETIKWIDHPLARVRCNSIAEDDTGNVWVGTVNGLLRIDDRGKMEVITPKEGIAQLNIIKVIFDTKKRSLVLLTPNAVSTIDTEQFLQNAVFKLPEIIIERVAVKNEPLNTQQPIYLDNKVQDLNVFVSSPMIKNRDKIAFSYKINGGEWTSFDGQKISIHSLPFGEMSITIRAQELFQPDNVKMSSIRFVVERPFYFTWWFISILGVLLLGAVSWIVTFYSRKKNLRLVEENKRLDVEHKALRNLLNPHFLYNAINSIHAFVLQNDQRKTLAYLAKFSQLVRLNLELLATDKVSIDKELKNISLYLEFEKLRFADKLNYEIRIDPAILNSPIQIPSFIIQPFLENAIWHGLLPRPEGGNLLLHVERQQEELVITIDDDGVGINTSLRTPKQELEDKTSMGINIIRERIELLKKFQGNYGLLIIDKSELNGKATGTGTLVKITVPVQ
jgi:ligand-binding sensor domain-containing protein